MNAHSALLAARQFAARAKIWEGYLPDIRGGAVGLAVRPGPFCVTGQVGEVDAESAPAATNAGRCHWWRTRLSFQRFLDLLRFHFPVCLFFALLFIVICPPRPREFLPSSAPLLRALILISDRDLPLHSTPERPHQPQRPPLVVRHRVNRVRLLHQRLDAPGHLIHGLLQYLVRHEPPRLFSPDAGPLPDSRLVRRDLEDGDPEPGWVGVDAIKEVRVPPHVPQRPVHQHRGRGALGGGVAALPLPFAQQRVLEEDVGHLAGLAVKLGGGAPRIANKVPCHFGQLVLDEVRVDLEEGVEGEES
mmetsp:Transcript_20443/g.43846  ORF Transcript_20443/g.43846 Transcript_20443/m.43846 type:complete len:303 (+) Transcript_20443:460-1368(+)